MDILIRSVSPHCLERYLRNLHQRNLVSSSNTFPNIVLSLELELTYI